MAFEQPADQLYCHYSTDDDDDDQLDSVPGTGPYLDDLVELRLADELLFFGQFTLHLLTLYSLCYLCSMRRFLADQVVRLRASLAANFGGIRWTLASSSALLLLSFSPSRLLLFGWLTFPWLAVAAVFPILDGDDDYIDLQPLVNRRRGVGQAEVHPAIAAAAAAHVVANGQGSSVARW